MNLLMPSASSKYSYPGRVVAKGYGMSVLIGKNNSEGTQMNRRTAVKMLEKTKNLVADHTRSFSVKLHQL